MYIEVNIGGQEQGCLPICWFWPEGWDIFEKEGTSLKCVEIDDWGFSVHFVLEFQDNSIYTYVLAKKLQNGATFIQQTDSWFKKSHELWQLQTSSRKS